MTYQWKAGARVGGDAQDIGRAIADLGPEVEPQDLVTAAEHPTNPLHSCFEWNNERGAREYRLIQAREILRSLVFVVHKEDEPDGVITVRAYENVIVQSDDDSRRVYIPTRKALRNDEFREQVFARLREDIENAKRTAERYAYLCESFGVVAAHLSDAVAALEA